MTNKNGTKRALLTSLLALLLCCSMLVGSTFAWFTDSATSGGNVIKSGTLDIALEKWNGTEFVELGENETVLNYDKWEPGYTEIINLRIVNKGNLALKWKGAILSETVLTELADVINVYLAMDVAATTQITDRAAFVAAKDSFYKTTLSKLLGAEFERANGELLPDLTDDGVMDAGTYSTLCIVLEMDTAAGNEYQNMDLGGAFDLAILATQYTYEEDSFDDQYDKNAEYLIPVNSGSGLNGALENGGDIVLKNDVTTDSFQVPADTTVNVDLNGNTLSGATAEVPAGSELNVSGGTIDVDAAGVVISGNATLTDVDMNAGSTADYAGITRGENAVTVYDDVNVASSGGGVAAADGAKVVFNSGSVEVDTKSTSGRYLFYAEGAGSEITINGGNFDFNKTQNQKRAYVYAGDGTTVTINGGTFGTASTRSGYTAGILGTGTIIIKGGTFGFDPSAWVADGYVANYDTTAKTWTVSAQ